MGYAKYAVFVFLLSDFRSAMVSTGLKYTQRNQFVAYSTKYCWHQGKSFRALKVKRVA